MIHSSHHAERLWFFANSRLKPGLISTNTSTKRKRVGLGLSLKPEHTRLRVVLVGL